MGQEMKPGAWWARRSAWAVALGMVAAACGGGLAADSDGDEEVGVVEDIVTTTTTAGSGGRGLPEGASALRDMYDAGFPEPLIDPGDIISGGPPPDGIPPIDEPRFVSVTEADEYLEGQEPVVILDIGGETRAYPVQVLMWHEIVNDTLGGVPVAITYCPLCNSAVSYQRVVRGVTTTFGTSGRLYLSALVMYDRATESLWTHFDGRAVVGLLAGEVLDPIPSPLVSWAEFKAAHPDALVLDRDSTGFSRPYGSNPYERYDDPDSFPFLFRGDADDRAALKQRVVGVTLGGEARAWSLDLLSRGGATATAGEVGGTDIVIFWKAGQSSALDDGAIAAGRDVGSVGVFLPEAGGRRLTFAVEGSSFFDNETGSEWDVTGTAVAGSLQGETLERVHHLDTFWFAWSSYQPGTDLIES